MWAAGAVIEASPVPVDVPVGCVAGAVVGAGVVLADPDSVESPGIWKPLEAMAVITRAAGAV